MNKTLTVAIVLTLFSSIRADEQIAKSTARPLRLTFRMLQRLKKEAGTDQLNSKVFDHTVLIHEDERFKLGQGGKKQFDDSGETQEWGDRSEGKIKFLDPLTVIVDLKITVSSGRSDPEPSGAFLIAGEHYQIHSKLKLGESGVIMLTKPGDDRPRWLELKVTPGHR